MEKIVVTDTDTVVVENVAGNIVVTGIMGPPGKTTITNADDVDTSQLTDGALLVYRAQTGRWFATNRLDNQILEAGQF
jgi:hypothetical protein